MTKFITLTGYMKDITGQRFGRLVALGPVSRNKRKNIMWLCRCDCGKTTEVVSNHLTGGRIRSCGCLRDETSKSFNTKHGKRHIRLYQTWLGMKQRCTNPNSHSYVFYGARGITVSQEWMDSFQTFYDHVTQLPNYGKKGYTLDRIDNNGPYTAGNVRWSNDVAQANNRRIRLDAVMLTHNNKTQGLTAWSKETGINRNTISNRFCRGWTTERILTTPAGPYYGRKRK